MNQQLVVRRAGRAPRVHRIDLIPPRARAWRCGCVWHRDNVSPVYHHVMCEQHSHGVLRLERSRC